MPKPNLRTVLFLCTGNYYRSRFAEVVFNAAVTKMGVPWTAVSRGLALERGVNNVGPIAPSVIEALHSRGLHKSDSLARMPTALTHDELEQAHRIIALHEAEHRPLLQERFPSWEDKVEYWDVEDALGVLDLIDREVMGLIARLFTGAPRLGPPELAPPPPAPTTTTETSRKKVILKVGRETAGRKGKGVTTVFDTPFNEAELLSLAAKLKQKCGTGGTVKEGRIEIQGDQRDRIIAELEKLGYQVKRAGG